MTGVSAETASQIAIFGRLVLVIFGGLYVMSNLIEFINVITFYIFIAMKLPSNLKFILYAFYTTMQASIIPINIPDIFSTYNDCYN